MLLSEIGEQEDLYAHNLDDSRAVLKTIRNTEKSVSSSHNIDFQCLTLGAILIYWGLDLTDCLAQVHPSREKKAKIADDIAKLKAKEPESAKLVILEQELVRAEAENLVAEAQLSNVVSALISMLHTLWNIERHLNTD